MSLNISQVWQTKTQKRSLWFNKLFEKNGIKLEVKFGKNKPNKFISETLTERLFRSSLNCFVLFLSVKKVKLNKIVSFLETLVFKVIDLDNFMRYSKKSIDYFLKGSRFLFNVYLHFFVVSGQFLMKVSSLVLRGNHWQK